MNLIKQLTRLDRHIITVLKKYHEPVARIAIFIVFFWFGILKILNVSPASPLVANLEARTLPFIPFHTFIILFSLYEMLIGVLFLIRGAERVAIALLALHMFTTFMPLVLLPQLTWQTWFVPTLEGQYILKNLVIIALAISIGADLHPLKKITL